MNSTLDTVCSIIKNKKTYKNLYYIGVFSFFFILSACQIMDIDEPTVIETEIVSEVAPTETVKAEPFVDSHPILDGTLHMTMNKPKTLHPLKNTDETVEKILSLLFEPIIHIDNNFIPVKNDVLINHINIFPNGLSIVIQIKEDIFWHDGMPILAEDLLYTLDTINMLQTPHKRIFSYIKSYEATDSKTVQIRLTEVYNGILHLFTFPIIPKHHYMQEENDFFPLGNGSFSFTSYTPPFQLTLDSEVGNFSQLVVNFVTDHETSLYSFEQGKVDIVLSSMKKWEKIRRTRKHNFYLFDTSIFDCLIFNHQNPIFQDKNIRKSFASLLSKEALNRIYLHNGVVSQQPIHPRSTFFEDVPIVEYDKERILSILPQDFQIDILVNEESEIKNSIATLLQNNLEILGFEASITKANFLEFEKKVLEGDFDMAIASVDIDFSFDLSSFLASDKNIFGYQNEELDTLLKNTMNQTNEVLQAKAFESLTHFLLDDMPVVGLAFQQQVLLLNNTIVGEILPLPSRPLYNVKDWFVFENNN